MSLRLTPNEQLELQQLEQIRFWQTRKPDSSISSEPTEKPSIAPHPLPTQWQLTRGVELHAWQNTAVEKWFASGHKGVIKVVTGAGKTILALALIERLQRTAVPDLRVAVVVPTVVLLDQWRDELLQRSNFPESWIALLGAGYAETFSDGARILIAVLNSASKKLAEDVERARISDRLLLVVDECHRAGAPEMQRVFDTKRAFSLGLSATPERDLDDDFEEESIVGDELESRTNSAKTFDDTLLGKQLGGVIFELNYAEAIDQGILPSFQIIHYGLPLSSEERNRYERASREIKDLQSDLQTRTRKGLALVRWCRSRAQAGNKAAARYISLLAERKRLLYRIQARAAAVSTLLKQTFAENEDASAILFHESIEEVMRLFGELREAGFRVVAEHSQFPDSMRANSIRLFRQGTAKVIVSAKSLIEGFNVPSAEIGIVVAASSSVRQRIQTLGRLLRRNRLSDGTEKNATLYVLYAQNSVDELIYEKADWEHFVGAERNEYFRWDPLGGSPPTLVGEAPRRPPQAEAEIPVEALRPGDPYPGDLDEAQSFSLDSQGNVRNEHGVPIEPNAELRDLLTRANRRAGRFRITPQRFFVFALDKDESGAWRGIYLGRLTAAPSIVSHSPDILNSEAKRLPGDPYPLDQAHGETFHVLARDHRLIARKEGKNVRFVVPLDQIDDPDKKSKTEHIQAALRKATAKGVRINRITVTPRGDVIYLHDNQAYFLGPAPEGASGFQLDKTS